MERKEAIEVLRKYSPKDAELREALETAVPELKESEDERIRKAIIDFFSEPGRKEYILKGFTVNDILAWLEKQGEQNLANSAKTCKDEPKFKVGDVIVEIKPNGSCPPVRIKYIGEGAYSCKSDDGKRFLSFPIISQDEYKLVEQKPAWSEEDEINLRKAIWYVENPAPMVVKDSMLVEWLKSFKERVQPQPKQEWSEEDNNALKVITQVFEVNGVKLLHYPGFVHWLKTLPNRITPQNTWKPSDEQMEYLAKAITTLGNEGDNKTSAILYELRAELKKLK